MTIEDSLMLDATQQLQALQAGQLTPTELIDLSLQRISEVQPQLNPFCFVYAEEALDQARQCQKNFDTFRKKQSFPPLYGLPVAIKDLTPTRGKRTTLGSHAYENWVPEHDALIVERLSAAGAIIIGKTTTPEFAWSSFTRSPLWGHTLNPWNLDCTSGGSSGGSAVAVTTGCVSLAEGTDMGGSVRIPAALCGIVGHKPSLGRIPMDILETTFDSISHFGPLCRSVADAARFMAVVEGPDNRDIQSQVNLKPIELPDAGSSLEGLTIAVSEDLGFYAVTQPVIDNMKAVTDALRERGATVINVDLGWSRDCADAWLDIWSVFLASAQGHVLDDYAPQMDQGLVDFMQQGKRLNAIDYRKLDTIRTHQWQKLATVFSNADCLLCPTMTQTAPLATALDADFEGNDAEGRLQALDMTSVFNNVAQCPVMSVPSGTDTNGMPTAVQLVGQRYDDPLVFRVAAAIEESLSWPRWTINELKSQIR